MFIGMLLVLGFFSYSSLPVDLFPEVDFPFVVIQTVYPGASAESVETEVTKNIEDVINEISGVKQVMSQSREAYSLIFVEFQLEVDGTVAAQDVREKVATIRQDLPDDIEEPLITQYDQDAMPVISIAISGKRPLRDITELTKNKIKTRLEVIPGVGSVQIIGGFDREILIALDPVKMEAKQITIDDISGAIAAANMEIPGGKIDEGAQEYLVRLKGRLTTVPEFEDVIVKNHRGVPVYVTDVGRVVDTIVEQTSLSRFNGETAIGLSIIKQSGANVVEMARSAKQVVAGLQKELPPDIEIKIVRDDSEFIEDSIHEIQFNMMFGTLLAVIVIFLFLLDYKPTIITGLAIPISIIATFTLMNFLGFTINMMTLMGLSLAVGILIDDAIVVVENIYRHLDMGKNPFKAAYDATREIGLAVSATTFTIIAVFLPVAFMEGIVGRFFYEFGISVAFAVFISLIVAFTLTPMLSSRMLTESELEKERRRKDEKGFFASLRKFLGLWNKAFDSLKPVYSKILGASLRHRWVVVLLATLLFFGSIVIFVFLPQEWFEQTDRGMVYVNIDTPPGTTLENTSKRMQQIEDIVTQLKEVEGTYVTIGSGTSEVTEGTVLILLTDAQEREISAQELTDSVRTLISVVPGIKTSVMLEQAEGGGEKPIEISIRGDDRILLNEITHEVQRLAKNIPGAIDIDNSLEEGKPEIQINVDRDRADDLGLSLMTIPMTIRTLVEGEVISRYKEGDEEYDVRIRLDKPYRSSVEDISRILVESDKHITGREAFLVPLNRVANLSKTTTIGEYRRFNRQNEVRVNSNALYGYASGTLAQELLTQANDSIDLPPGYSITAVGQEEIRNESNQNMATALILSIIFIYILLASQYESFFDPFSIMLSLPLSLIGAFLGLAIFGSPMSIMASIGIIMLMGLVTKNAILLIDFVKQQRRKGVVRFEAVMTAGPIRLRPILMTTFATVLGMLPLALGIGPGAEMRAPMARAAIGGLLSSTILTLIVVPVVYTLVDDFVGFFTRLFGINQGREEVTFEEPEGHEPVDNTQQ